ncbi:flippase [bacterium]|nr:flippase [bacterium]
MNFFEKLKSLIPTSSTKKVALKGVTWLAGDKIFRLALSMFTGALVARYLEPQKYGMLNSLTAFVALFGPIANIGVNSIILRDIAAHPEKERKIVNGAIILKLIGGTTAFLLALSIALFSGQQQYQPLLVIFASFHFLFYFVETLETWFLAKHDQKKPVVAGQISFIATSALRVLFVLFDMGLPAILLTYTFDSIFGGILVYFYARKYLNFRFTQVVFDKKFTKEMFSETLPLIFSGFGSTLYTKIDKVIMPWLTSAYVIGIYSAATRLSELWYFIPFSINTVFSPLIAEAKTKSPEIYEKRIRKSFIIINLVTLGIALLTTVTGYYAIYFIYGEQYLAATSPLLIHIWSLPIFSMGLVVDIWLLNQRLQKIQVARTFITAALNITLNIILVPRYGAVGAATATLISYTYPSFFANLIDKRTREIFWMELQSVLPTPKNITLIFEK